MVGVMSIAVPTAINQRMVAIISSIWLPHEGLEQARSSAGNLGHGD